MTSVYVVLMTEEVISSIVLDVPPVAICSSMLYDVSRQGEQYSMYM